LDKATRSFFEPRFNADLSHVRIFTDSAAGQSARSIDARAYTLGSNIVFGQGEYDPQSDSGKQLIAHELAHVGQAATGRISRQKIHRSSCPHDEPIGSGCGVFTWNGAAGELPEFVQVGTDRIITATLGQHLGGVWVPQLLTPPNPEKKGKSHGFVDAAKVKLGADLVIEVLEIKSRNTNNGGCSLATTETKGYLKALRPLAPHIVNLSAGLAKEGGLRTDECRKMTAAEKKILVKAGLDVNNPDSVRAWCLYNDLQKKLNTKFTTAFNSVTFAMNTDGDKDVDYLVGVVPIPCKRGRKTTIGKKKLFFQVNKFGGLSYRCKKECNDEEEKQKEKEKVEEIRKEVELPADKQLKSLEQEGDEEYDPIEDDIRLPSDGISVTDVAIVTVLGISAVTTIHLMAKKAATEAEKKALQAAAKKVIDKMAQRGASQAAKHLNSANLAKLGTKAYEKAALKKAQQEAAKRLAKTTEEKIAKRLASKLGKNAAKKAGKKIAGAAAKAVPFVGVILFAADAYGAVDDLSKGAEIEIGLGGDDLDLGSGTDIEVKADGKSDTTATIKTERTEIDLEMTKMPNVSGLQELEAKDVKIKGKVDGANGDPVVVNMKVKIGNSTITYRSLGVFKGGNIVIDGGLEITDSEIEIDLPPGTVLDPPEPGQHRVIKGAKIKVTKVGTGGQTGPATGSTQQGAASGGGQAAPQDEQRKKLLADVEKEPGVKKLYDTLVKSKGIPVTDEVLRRLLALKDQLKQHPELVDRLIGTIQKGKLEDPIKDLIEPMEAELKKALEEKAKGKTAPTPEPPKDSGTSNKQPDQAPAQTPQSTPTAPASGPTCNDATKLSLWSLVDLANGQASGASDVTAVKLGQKKFDESTDKPTETAESPVYIARKTPNGLRKYTVVLHGNDMKPASNWDRKQFIWAADYEFTVPNVIVKSEQGDEPICFSDSGTTRRMIWGSLKKKGK
jgi:hypothetical protein